MAAATIETRYRVQGMDCAGCAQKIDTAVRRIEGVADVRVSVAAGTLTVGHVDGGSIRATIEQQVTRLGYRLNPVAGAAEEPAGPHGDHAHDHDHAHADHDHGHDHADPFGGETVWWRQPKIVLTAGCGLALVAAYLMGHLLPDARAYLFLAAMLVGLVPIARRAIAAAATGTPFSIEMLMTVAAIGAVIIGAAEEGAAVVFLFLVGELLEGVAAGRARASIRGLSALVPKVARVEDPGGTIREMPVERVPVGSVVQVRPGDRIAADGIILSGSSGIDEAPVTGESMPRQKEPGDRVFAGTINGEAVLRVQVTAAAADNTIARIVRRVEEAQESKAPTERFINRFSRWYTPGVVVVAALVAVLPPLLAGESWDAWIYKGLAILLIGCPCALVISTPAAIAAALSAGARRGLLMKGGAVLEEVGRVDLVAFDKTGTLTEGKPKVTDIVGFGRSETDVLRLAAALESGSSHPLAAAILERAGGMALPSVQGARALGGKGVMGSVGGVGLFLGSARMAAEIAPLDEPVARQVQALTEEGKTVSVLLASTAPVGAIALRDEPRVDARAGLAALGQAGVRAIMLTGDNRRTAEAIGRELGVEVRAELLPEDKQRIVGELQASGQRVAQVGDGINDAPALAAADVGIAMGGGTDVALETADAAVLHGRVGDVAAMIRLSRAAMANIRQNITIALGLKAVFLVTTVVGVTGLWPAILADTGATVLVTANAMRLLGWRPSAA